MVPMIFTVAGIAAIILKATINLRFKDNSISSLLAFLCVAICSIVILQSQSQASTIGMVSENQSLIPMAATIFLGGLAGICALHYVYRK